MTTAESGWSTSLLQMPSKFGQSTIYGHVGGTTEKHRLAGYQMFKCDKVQHVATRKIGSFFEIKSVVGASYSKVLYKPFVSMDLSGNIYKASCTCKAGALGKCKHVAATLYQLNDYKETNVLEIPAAVACTEQPRKWGVKKGKAPVISKSFSELVFVKHTPGKTPKSIENTKRRLEYSSLPPAKMPLPKTRIEELAQDIQPYRQMWSQIMLEVNTANNHFHFYFTKVKQILASICFL